MYGIQQMERTGYNNHRLDPRSTRTTFYSIVYLNKVWIYSGKTGRRDSWSGDVWTMTKSLTEKN